MAAPRVRRGLQLFNRHDARSVDETAMSRPPTLDQAALDALPEFSRAGGFARKLLFGEPDSQADGGMSLVWLRFAPNYPLPRHSHSVDCVYYIVAGEVRLGNQTVRAGEGFFVPADAPYAYSVGPEGLELLEFRSKSSYDSQVRESAEGWARILETVRANRDRWAIEVPSYQ